jgi:repressor LexA
LEVRSRVNVGNNIRELRRRHDLTQEELADALEVSKFSVSRWERGDMAVRERHVERMCELYGVTRDDILSTDHGLAAQLRDPDGPLRSGVRMPLMGWTHAGEPMEEIAGDDYAYVPPVVAQNHPRGFLLRVRGGCMDRVIPDGSLVCVDPDAEPSTGRIVVLEPTEGESVMRRIYRGNRWVMLVADSWSGEHEDIVLREGDSNRLLGVVVWWQAAGES